MATKYGSSIRCPLLFGVELARRFTDSDSAHVSVLPCPTPPVRMHISPCKCIVNSVPSPLVGSLSPCGRGLG